MSRPGMLLLALLHKENKACGDAHTAHQPAKHIHPAQQPVAEVLQVQTCQNVLMLSTTVRGGSSRSTSPVLALK